MNAQLRDPDEGEWTDADEAAELRSEYPPEKRPRVTWQQEYADEVGVPLTGPL